MKRKCEWVYRFHLFDGENVFTYCLKAVNVKHAIEQMEIVIDRDFPEFDIIDRERISSASKYSGGLNFPVYVDDLSATHWKYLTSIYGRSFEHGHTL